MDCLSDQRLNHPTVAPVGTELESVASQSKKQKPQNRRDADNATLIRD